MLKACVNILICIRSKYLCQTQTSSNVKELSPSRFLCKQTVLIGTNCHGECDGTYMSVISFESHLGTNLGAKDILVSRKVGHSKVLRDHEGLHLALAK
jgi:hypothetical protein